VRVPHDHSGAAFTAQGFTTDGTGVTPGTRTLALVIPSMIASTGISGTDGGDEMLNFDTGSVDASRLLLGNTHGIARALWTHQLDVDGDGGLDLVGVFSAEAVRQLKAGSTTDDGPIGLHYQTDTNVDYLVPDVFALTERVVVPDNMMVPPSTGGGTTTRQRVVVAEETQSAPVRPTPPPAPTETRVEGVHPNPFADGVTVAFALAHPTRVELAVYDVAGARVRTLRSGAFDVGRYQVAWDGRDDAGRTAPAGIYMIRMSADRMVRIAKVVRMR
jgi:hypothetical protein